MDDLIEDYKSDSFLLLDLSNRHCMGMHGYSSFKIVTTYRWYRKVSLLPLQGYNGPVLITI